MLYNILMFFWDNRFMLSAIVVSFVVGYIVGNPRGIDIFFQDRGDYNAKS